MRGVTVYRTLYFLPVATLPAAVALTWKWLFNGDYGHRQCGGAMAPTVARSAPSGGLPYS